MDDSAQLRFSTEALPERERIAAFRELYGRKMLRLEMEPQSDTPFHADFALRVLPGVGIVSAASSLVRVGRTRELLADSDDNLILQIASSAGVASQLGREVAVGPGDAVLLSAADIGHFTYASAPEILAVSLPRAALAPLLRDSGAALVRPIPAQSQALRLLLRYLRMVQDMPALAGPELQRGARLRSSRGSARRNVRRGASRRGSRRARGAATRDQGRRYGGPRSCRAERCPCGEATPGHAALRADAVRGGRDDVLAVRARATARSCSPHARRSASTRAVHQRHRLFGRIRRSFEFQSRIPSAVRCIALGCPRGDTQWQPFLSPRARYSVAAAPRSR
jgi:hypothetical protein